MYAYKYIKNTDIFSSTYDNGSKTHLKVIYKQLCRLTKANNKRTYLLIYIYLFEMYNIFSVKPRFLKYTTNISDRQNSNERAGNECVMYVNEVICTSIQIIIHFYSIL